MNRTSVLNFVCSTGANRSTLGQMALAIYICMASFIVMGCDAPPTMPVVQAESAQENPVAASPIQDSTAPNDGVTQRVGQFIERTQQQGSKKAEAAGDWIKDQWLGAADASSQMSSDAMGWANQTFNDLKSKGLTTANSTGQWLTEDWNNMESWEYKVVASDSIAPEQLEQELNRLGTSGWECFSSDDQKLIFKKPKESYLRRLPFKDLLRLAPLMNQK